MSRHTNGIFRTWSVSLVAVAACYSPPKPDCGFICGAGGACPTDYFCAHDGRCHLNGTSETMCADAGIPDSFPIDVAAPDLTAPTVVSTDPANAATGIALDKLITVTFDEPVTFVSMSTFVTMGGSALTGTMAATSGTTYVFTPDAPWPAASTIDVTLASTITDLSGNPLTTYMFSFQTQ